MNQPAQNTNGRGKNARRKSGGSGRSRRPNRSAAKHFWTATAAPADLEPGPIRPVTDADAMVRSLGPPSLPGHSRLAAEHYLAAVYDKAVNMAGLLAAAGELIEVEELEDLD